MISAHVAEMIVFVFLGIVTVSIFLNEPDLFELNFTLWNILFITVIRFIVVFGLGFILNSISLRQLSVADLLVISYSGLRGGIAFGMIYSLSLNDRIMYVQTTLCVIFFTVFIQGASVGPLLNFLKGQIYSLYSRTCR